MKILRSVLFIGFSLANFALVGQNSVQKAIDNFSKQTDFHHASISFLAIDVENGEKIAAYNEEISLIPASTVKLFSTASALELLGSDYKPETQLIIYGEIDAENILQGDLVIKGGGDMTLGSQYFNEENQLNAFLDRWVEAIKGSGIKTIAGSVIADGSDFGYEGVPDGWSWSDMGNYYGTGFSGINLYDNMIRFHFKTAAAGTLSKITKIEPEIEQLKVSNYVMAANVSGDNSYIYGAPYSNERFATGEIPANRSDFVVKGSLPDPELQLAIELYEKLNSAGIKVQEGPSAFRLENFDKLKSRKGTIIHTEFGPSTLEIATITNHKSINLFAEGLLRQVGFEKNKKGSTSDAVDLIEQFWATKFNTGGLFLKDGSGLSRSNGVSAKHYCELLKYMAGSSKASDFKSTLPIAGVSGTLGSVCKNQAAHGKMFAKSGTMSRIKSYAGYIDSKSGKKIAFALIINNFEGSSSNAKNKMEDVFNALAVY